jgi:hypothetical protein
MNVLVVGQFYFATRESSQKIRLVMFHSKVPILFSVLELVPQHLQQVIIVLH